MKHATLSVAIIALVVAGVAGVGHADKAADVREARAHFKEGGALYQSGDYEGAIVEFETAYKFSPLPDILFNIGQAYRLRGNKAAAHKYYSRFLEAKPSGPLSDEAREHVVALTKALADEAEARAAKARSQVTPVVVVAPLPPPPPPAKVPVYKRWWLWTAVGVVVAGAAVGIGIGAARAPANFGQTFPDVGPGRQALGVHF